jgi:uncharacterized protein with HEPN domain
VSKSRIAAVERLKHMAEAAERIGAYVVRGREAYDRDPAIRDAILYQVIVLGEAAKSALIAEPALESELPEVEWSPIARMRDRVTHRYWATDPEIVWTTATVAVPELGKALASALERFR